MTAEPTVHEVYAIKYAEHARNASANFIGGDRRDEPMPMDYYVWVVKGGGRAWVVDTGFGRAAADARGRRLLEEPCDAIRRVGLRADDVRDVIVTHLHYDHAGTCDRFPAATFHLQDREMQFATGRYMAHRCMHEAYNVFDVVVMVRHAHEGRVRYHDGDAELAPGLSVHLIGGHTLGLQVVRVRTARGWVVLASDAAHYYRNMDEERPFPIVADVGQMVEGWRRVRALADSADHVIPGHDPLVLARYPALDAGSRGRVARVDVAPVVLGD